jgi:hypothetical protein
LEKNVDKVDVDKTLHGMRTAFSSWATRLGYKEADIERGLSHIRGYGSAPVVIYEDPLRALFEDWATYCFTGELPKGRRLREPAEVVPMLRRHQPMK